MAIPLGPRRPKEWIDNEQRVSQSRPSADIDDGVYLFRPEFHGLGHARPARRADCENLGPQCRRKRPDGGDAGAGWRIVSASSTAFSSIVAGQSATGIIVQIVVIAGLARRLVLRHSQLRRRSCSLGIVLGVAGASFAVALAARVVLVSAGASGHRAGHRRRRQFRHGPRLAVRAQRWPSPSAGTMCSAWLALPLCDRARRCT